MLFFFGGGGGGGGGEREREREREREVIFTTFGFLYSKSYLVVKGFLTVKVLNSIYLVVKTHVGVPNSTQLVKNPFLVKTCVRLIIPSVPRPVCLR